MYTSVMCLDLPPLICDAFTEPAPVAHDCISVSTSTPCPLPRGGAQERDARRDEIYQVGVIITIFEVSNFQIRIKRDLATIYREPPPGMFVVPDKENMTRYYFHILLL